MRSHPHSKNSIPSRNSGRQRSWQSFWNRRARGNQRKQTTSTTHLRTGPGDMVSLASVSAILPNLDLLDAAGLKVLILSQHDELVVTQQRLLPREREVEHLKLLIATLRRTQFGSKSGKAGAAD
jgi:hypothetical protein